MAIIGSAEVAVGPSFKGFQTSVASQMAKSSRVATNSFATGTEKAGLGRRVSGVLGHGLITGAKATGVAVAGVLGYALVKGFQRLNAIEQAQAKLRGLGNSAKDVKNIMNNALAAVKGTAFGLDEAATVAANAVAAGVKPGKDLEHTLKLVADAATIGGTSMAEMGSIFNKVATSGKIQADVMNQLNDRGIPIIQLLGKAMGKTSKQVQELSKKGKIDFADFQKAMEMGMGGAALKSGNTVQGAFKNVQAALGRLGAAFLQGVFPHLQKGFTNLITFIDNLTEKIGPIANVIGSKLGGAFQRVTAILAKMKFDSFSAWIKSISGSTPKLGKFSTALHGIGDTLKGWTSQIDFSAVLSGLGRAAKQATPTIKQFIQAIPSIAAGVGKGIVDFFHALIPAVKQVAPAAAQLGGILGNVLGKAIQFVSDHMDTIIKILPFAVAGFIAAREASKAYGVAQTTLAAAQLKAIPLNITNNALRIVAEVLARRNARAVAQETVATEANNAAKSRGLVTMVRTAAAWVAQRAAMIAAAVAQRTVTAAQWLMNAAMSANPIGLLVIGIAALVAGLILAYKKSETFRKIVQAAWNGIKTAAVAVFHWFSKSFIPFFTKTIPNAFKSLIGWVKKHWPTILAILTGPVGLATLFIVKHKNKIIDTFKAAWNWVSKTFKKLWSGITRIFTHPVDSARQAVSVLLGATGLRRPFNAVWGWVSGYFKRVWAGLKMIFTHPIQAGKNIIENMLGRNGLQRVFSRAVDAIKKIWGGIKSAFSAPIKWVLDHVVNRGLFKGINTVLRFVGMDKQQIKWIDTAGFASGGIFRPDRYTPGKDIGVAALSGSEAIMRPEFTRGVGARWIEMMNDLARKRGVKGVRQFFLGEYKNGGVTQPINARITQGIHDAYTGFPAVDAAASIGHPVVAGAAGKVLRSYDIRGYEARNAVQNGYRSYGRVIEMQHAGFKTLYAHLSQRMAQAGAILKAGQQLGLSGNTGHSTGPHLHFGAAGRDARSFWTGFNQVSGGGGSFLANLLNPAKVITGVVSRLLGGLSRFGSSPLISMVRQVPLALAKRAVDWAKGRLANFGGSNPGGSGVARWRSTVVQALKMNGISPSTAMVAAWLRQIGTESGGNANAIQQIHDINSASGNLARGLAQVIPTTFNAFRARNLPNNIFNPLANLFAAINYARHTYPNMLSVIGQGRGYANGTMYARRGLALVGERGPELLNMRGGEQVWNERMIRAAAARGQSRSIERVRLADGQLEFRNGKTWLRNGVLEIIHEGALSE